MSDLVEDLNAYYREVWHNRIRNWDCRQSLALHLGLDQADEADHDAARSRLNRDVLVHLLEREVTPDKAAVVDLGCGVCGTALDLSERMPEWIFTAVDCDTEMLELARSFIVQRGGIEGYAPVYRIDLVRSDYHNVILSQGTHDAIFAVESVSQSWDRRRLVENVLPMLKPGGVFAVVDVFPRMVGHADRAWAEACDGLHLCAGLKSDLQAEMERAGLVDVEWEDWTDRVMPSVDLLASVSTSAGEGAWDDYQRANRAIRCLYQSGAVRYGILSGVKPD